MNGEVVIEGEYGGRFTRVGNSVLVEVPKHKPIAAEVDIVKLRKSVESNINDTIDDVNVHSDDTFVRLQLDFQEIIFKKKEFTAMLYA